MWNFFSKKKYQKISFEDLQFVLKNNESYILINTLPTNEQGCLIKNTLLSHLEENMINEFINQYDFKNPRFVIYGKNCNDETAEIKYDQLVKLGFSTIYLYSGGLFEWLLLQDIYGTDEFPTTCKFLDILKYKPTRTIGGKYLL